MAPWWRWRNSALTLCVLCIASMSEQTAPISPYKRRIFLRTKDKTKEIFTFIQRNDGSIYCSSPDLADARYISCYKNQEQIHVATTEELGEGKISLHGSGITLVRPNSDPKGHRLVVQGNHLLDKKNNRAGVRHLFSIMMSEPKHYREDSPVLNRKTDYLLEANENLAPLSFIFFAIPIAKITLDFQFSMHKNDMNNIPNDILGFHAFDLKYHNIFWLAYRTKHMEKWPKNAQVCYYDGYMVPVFIGTNESKDEKLGSFRLEFREPIYSFDGEKLQIQFHSHYPQDYKND